MSAWTRTRPGFRGSQTTSQGRGQPWLTRTRRTSGPGRGAHRQPDMTGRGAGPGPTQRRKAFCQRSGGGMRSSSAARTGSRNRPTSMCRRRHRRRSRSSSSLSRSVLIRTSRRFLTARRSRHTTRWAAAKTCRSRSASPRCSGSARSSTVSGQNQAYTRGRASRSCSLRTPTCRTTCLASGANRRPGRGAGLPLGRLTTLKPPI